MRIHGRFTSGTLLTALVATGSALALEPGQNEPKRLFSLGDSMTRGFNANGPLDNLNLSWVNGYHGFWEDLFGLPDVQSHNQRIDANFGTGARSNQTAAVNGETMSDLMSHASGAAGKNVTFATVLLGANDVCKDSIADLSTDEQFRTRFENGMDTLLANLAAGATVQVVAIPNIVEIYNQGRVKQSLGLVDCPDVWARSGSCGSVLSPDATDSDRAFALSRIMGYNQILKEVTENKAAQHQEKFISFTETSTVSTVPGKGRRRCPEKPGIATRSGNIRNSIRDAHEPDHRIFIWLRSGERDCGTSVQPLADGSD